MLVRVAIAVVLLILPTALHAQAEKRIALLIGNRAYDTSVGVLKNPHNDIAVVGEALTKQGFEVLPPIKDARRSTILGGVRELARKLNTAGAGAIGFLYYSGHGAAEKDTNINYLIPVDAKEPGSTAFWDESVKLDDILRLLDGARSAAKFIVFDACRNELQLPSKDTTKGLLPVADQQGMFIAFASAPGRTASDWGNKSGPYAEALAAELGKPGVDHLGLFQNVKEAVYAVTGGAQQPWESNGLVRRIYLTGDATPSPQPPAASARLSEAAEAWDRTKDTTSIYALEAFIGRFGDSYYGDLAKVRLADLKQAVEAAARKKSDEEARAKAEAERQRLAMLQREEEARKRADVEEARRKAEIQTEWNDCTSDDPERQIRGCTALIARDQSNAIAFYNRGNAFSKKKDYDRAISDYNKAIELDPKQASAYYNRGLVYANKKEHDRAIADFSKAIELDPKFVHAYHDRGLVYANKNDYDRAITDFNKVIELDPKFRDAYNNRGWCYYEKKDYDRAITDYNKAIELDPKYVLAYYNRGLAYVNKQDYDRAIVDYSRAIELDPKHVFAYYNRGFAYGNKQDYDRAIADYNRAIELDPKFVFAYGNRGHAYEMKKDKNRAIADYRKALELDPNHRVGSNGLKRLGANP